jgi:Leucine-rich repeat (LRR) protein
LTTLNISNGRLEKLQPSWFLRKNIITLTASKNKIVTIKKEDMRVLTKVKSLNLSSNAIEMIEANAFSDMKQLENLRLYDNQIKVIIFGPIENLKYLNLRDNSFQMVSLFEAIAEGY